MPVNVIFSRKGWDSEYGGKPNPIFEDGSMLSLPIPRQPNEPEVGIDRKFSDIIYKGTPLTKIIEGIHKSFIDENLEYCHPDPAINRELFPKDIKNWLPAVGYRNKSKHRADLTSWGVGPGDIFLFYGTFKPVEYEDGLYRYKKCDLKIHAIYGYLIIDRIVSDPGEIRNNFTWHPHASKEYLKNKDNRLYIPNIEDLDSYGCFKFAPELCLTKEYKTKSVWKLPDFFRNSQIRCEKNGKYKLTHYHDHIEFHSPSRGQEFVFTFPDEFVDTLTKWIKNIAKAGSKK